MINLKELRVDNWVYNSYTKQNTQVYPMMIPQLHRIEKENGSLKDCNIEPIPLTEEILLKCGFDKGILEPKHYYIEGMGILSCNDMFLCDKNGVHIKYLHQLQNIFFALNGEELKIEI